MWDVGGQDKIRPLWRHRHQGTNGNSRCRVEDAKEELNKIIEDELRDAVVLACVNTLTSSTATRLGAGGDGAASRGKVQARGADGAGRGKADKGCGRSRWTK